MKQITNTSQFAPAPYTGTSTEVVDALTAGTNIPASRLLAVAAWHDRKSGRRHGAIAAKLRAVAGQMTAANDNVERRVAA